MNFKIQFVIYGVYTLLLLNIIMFIFLLIHKIIDRKIGKKDEKSRRYYENIIEDFISNNIEDIPEINTRRELLIFKSALLESLNRSNKNQQDKLLEIAREVGLVKIEMEYLNNASEARKAIAAYFLGEIGAKEATEELINNIDRSNKELSYVICRALILVGGIEYIDIIIDILRVDDFIMKSRILDLISLIHEEDIYPKMREYLEGTDIFKRVLALEALGNRKDKRVFPYIGQAISSSQKELKISGLKAVIEIGYLDCEDIISDIKMLKDDEEWEVRAFLAKALGEYNDCGREEIMILKEMVEDLNWFVRFNSSESLLRLGENGVVALSEILCSSDEFAKDRAWAILQREIELYSLFDRIKAYVKYDYIFNNIVSYEKSINGGALVES
ncbi:HEAT repeat domain-containing protein [Tissierella carlieri]|jgi:HEAT repeat protein|uniref:HEAT repeat domain-containing protein n=1 Tax=Tissierella carlieri TaxID=689904 RepID=UPI001C11431B|nr:HEAT repeat domain-containing protein [Tissierella carlieri]MBU5312272.1 HEAT repeat domain-containing protein [Tissierella carlieri]